MQDMYSMFFRKVHHYSGRNLRIIKPMRIGIVVFRLIRTSPYENTMLASPVEPAGSRAMLVLDNVHIRIRSNAVI